MISSILKGGKNRSERERERESLSLFSLSCNRRLGFIQLSSFTSLFVREGKNIFLLFFLLLFEPKKKKEKKNQRLLLYNNIRNAGTVVISTYFFARFHSFSYDLSE